MSAPSESFETTNFRWLRGDWGALDAAQEPRTLREVVQTYREHAGDILGLDAFEHAIRSLDDTDDRFDHPLRVSGIAQEALDRFLGRTHVFSRSPPALVPRVFVSHRQRIADVRYAERIACLAQCRGFGYWLDLHDPLLATLARAPVPAPIHAVVTALIIELALLNCTHSIAVVTPDAAGSLWIPYEYGRAKARRILSNQCAAWLHPRMIGAPLAEYLLLGQLLPSERDVEDWLEHEARRLFGYAACSAPSCTTSTAPLP